MARRSQGPSHAFALPDDSRDPGFRRVRPREESERELLGGEIHVEGQDGLVDLPGEIRRRDRVADPEARRGVRLGESPEDDEVRPRPDEGGEVGRRLRELDVGLVEEDDGRGIEERPRRRSGSRRRRSGCLACTGAGRFPPPPPRGIPPRPRRSPGPSAARRRPSPRRSPRSARRARTWAMREPRSRRLRRPRRPRGWSRPSRFRRRSRRDCGRSSPRSPS